MKTKRILALLFTCVLSVCLLAVPASAANVTMDGAASEYSAYRLLDLSQGLKPGHTDGDACDITDEVAAAEHFAYKYTVNKKYVEAIGSGLLAVDPNVWAGFTPTPGMVEAAEHAFVIEYISGLQPDEIRLFADGVYSAIGSLEPEMRASKTFTGLADGYYLIAETATAGDGDSVSLVMLDTAGKPDITVTSKEDVPTLEKKILGYSEGYDSCTAAVGDEIFYAITVTAPKDEILSQYDTYKYVIHDDIGDGLRFDGVMACFVNGNEDWAVTPDKIAVRGTDEMADAACDVEFTFNDVKPFFVAVQPGRIEIDIADTLTIVYKCVVTEAAVTGASGNSNTAHLEFSNNPYATDETTESTTKDKVTVFTFALKVNKTDGENPLSGAGFTLYKVQPTPSSVDYYSRDDHDGIVVPAVGGDDASFLLSGLGEGVYKLVETTVPDGYQKCDDVVFEIRAEYDVESDDPQLTSLSVYDKDGNLMSGEGGSFTTTLADGAVSTVVVNVTGSRLPTTGGTGAYLIYAGAAAFILIGVVLFVVKNRKSGGEA